MAQFVIANNVNTQLAAALPSSGAGSTTVVLASSANLPTLSTATGQMMPLTLNDAATGAIYETVYVTAISGATLTVLRAQEGTSPLNWNVGDFAFCGPTAGTVGLTTMRTQYQESAAYSTSQTLTAAIAGESIGFTGTSAATFSLPGQSTVPNLTPTAVYNDGTAALTLTANGSDKFVVATGQVTSIVMQPGDDLAFYASVTAGLWTAFSGSALRQYEPLVVAPATASQHAVQFAQVAGVVGSARNLKCQQAAAGTSLTYTADEFVVESALGGLRYCLPNFSETINGATTGLGGLDTGALAASTWYVIYAARTSAGAAGIFAQLEPSAGATSVYGGANLPAGVIATGLLGVWKTNASGQFIIGFQVDRTMYLARANVLNSTTVESAYTALSISGVAPKCGRTVSGDSGVSNSTASSMSVSLATDINSTGAESTSINGTGGSWTFSNLALSVAQEIYYQTANSAGTATFNINISSFTF